MASSNNAEAPNALAESGDKLWAASSRDVDADGDFVYSVMLSSSQNQYVASLRMNVANVNVILLFVQCRERPGRWSVATSAVRNKISV